MPSRQGKSGVAAGRFWLVEGGRFAKQFLKGYPQWVSLKKRSGLASQLVGGQSW